MSNYAKFWVLYFVVVIISSAVIPAFREKYVAQIKDGYLRSRRNLFSEVPEKMMWAWNEVAFEETWGVGKPSWYLFSVGIIIPTFIPVINILYLISTLLYLNSRR